MIGDPGDLVGAAGSASYTNGTFTIDGSGADIWGTADGFNYLYQTASGDCDIKARVVSVGNTAAGAKAGVIIRETLNANSAHASMLITSGSGAAFIRRTSTGGTSAITSTTSITAPYWVRVQRSGSTFTTSISSNGTSWTTVGSATISMGTSVYIGLGVTSQSDGTLNESTVDNVTATP